VTLERVALDDPRWVDLASSDPAALPYHNPAWAQLLADCYRFDGFALVDREGANGVPVLEVRSPAGKRRWISLPFTDVCPPLGPVELGPALDEARRAMSRSLELRGAATAGGASVTPVGVFHTLDLSSGPDALFAGFNRSQVQRGVRKAEKEAVEVRRGERREDLVDTFYGLHLATRARQGVPVQPRRFFRLLWERLLDRGDGFVSLAYAGGRPVAGAVFLTWQGAITYKFGASDPAFLKLRPNHAIFWDAIRSASATGLRTMDFGRTELDNTGLREFKSGWGAQEQPLLYSGFGTQIETGHGRAERILGAVIRRSPAWVCRGLGEALYRYAA
jgi:CelD/BcsL family acetyltransferase involved in cellulose biosynthesis